AEYDQVLAQLAEIQRRWASKMLVNAKCAPHFVRTLLSADSPAPFPKSFGGGAGGCPAGTHYMGIRPNGDVTPCPYLPLFAGNLRTQSLTEIWQSSDLFVEIRSRSRLGGRCGDCELNTACGGCRARAFGETGDVMAEDPLCTHQPGTFPKPVAPAVEYGSPAGVTLAWDPAARERIRQIPAFVRGMVAKRVEAYCRDRQIGRVSEEVLAEIRAKMPTPKLFGSGR